MVSPFLDRFDEQRRVIFASSRILNRKIQSRGHRGVELANAPANGTGRPAYAWPGHLAHGHVGFCTIHPGKMIHQLRPVHSAFGVVVRVDVCDQPSLNSPVLGGNSVSAGC